MTLLLVARQRHKFFFRAVDSEAFDLHEVAILLLNLYQIRLVLPKQASNLSWTSTDVKTGNTRTQALTNTHKRTHAHTHTQTRARTKTNKNTQR